MMLLIISRSYLFLDIISRSVSWLTFPNLRTSKWILIVICHWRFFGDIIWSPKSNIKQKLKNLFWEKFSISSIDISWKISANETVCGLGKNLHQKKVITPARLPLFSSSTEAIRGVSLELSPFFDANFYPFHIQFHCLIFSMIYQ